MTERKKTSTYYLMDPQCHDYEPYVGISPFPGYHGFHCHDFYEFYVFFSGAPYHSIGGQVTPLTPCTLAIIPPFRMHGLVGRQTDTPYERAWIYITPAMIQKLSLDTPNLESFFRSTQNTGRSYFTIRRRDAERLRDIIEAISMHMHDTSELGKWQNSIRIADFLSYVFALTQNADVVPRPVILNNSIHTVLAYIDDHYREQITIPDLSRRFGISASYMTREFSAYTGRSVYDYILYRRILSAKEMISIGRPFTQIAFECGFNDYSCFLRAFHKLTGQSPREYRKYLQTILPSFTSHRAGKDPAHREHHHPKYSGR